MEESITTPESATSVVPSYNLTLPTRQFIQLTLQHTQALLYLECAGGVQDTAVDEKKNHDKVIRIGNKKKDVPVYTHRKKDTPQE